MDRYGERIKIARKRAGFTQEQLGKAIGVSGVAVMRYEKNLRTPSTDTLIEIAEILDCNFLYLLGVSSCITEEDQIKHNREKREMLHDAVKNKDARPIYEAMGLDYDAAALSGLDLIGTIEPKPLTFNTNVDPEWATLDQMIKDGTITSEERQRFAELNQQAIDNAREKFEFEKEKIRNLLSKLTVAELFDVLDLVTEEVKKQTNGEESK